MASVQVVCLIAIACILLVSVVQTGRHSKHWMHGNWSDLHEQRDHSVNGSFKRTENRDQPTEELSFPAETSSSDGVRITSQHQTFAAAAAPSNANQIQSGGPSPSKLPGTTSQRQRPQRFDSPEHRQMGNLAATRVGTKRVRLAKGYDVSFGDMVAMADYFESPEQIWSMANQTGKGPGTREEVEYVRVVKIHGHSRYANRFSPEIAKTVEKRHLELATRNENHFTTPREKYAHLPPHRQPDSASHRYRTYHLRAIGRAIAAGRHGQSLNSALRQEGFGAHYLTDAISAGHVRTPRQDIKDWWDARDPGLDEKFRNYLAVKISEQVINNGRLVRFVPGLVIDRAKRSIDEALADKPKLTMGTLVSLALHDQENQQGLDVLVNGSRNRVAGDGFLKNSNVSQRDKSSTVTLGADAVQAGIEDLRRAHAMAARHPKMSPREIVRRLKDQDGLFASERFIPTVDSSRAARLPNWKVESVDDLLNDPKMMDALEVVVLEKIKVLEGLGSQLDRRARKAILDPNTGVVAQIKANPQQALKQILQYDGSLETQLRDNGLSSGFPF